MNKALLGTNMLSEIGKATNPTVAANAKTYRRSFGHFTLSTISVMEVVNGSQRTQAIARLGAFLATLPHMEIIDFDQSAAELAGRIAGDLERTGQPIGVPDTDAVYGIALASGPVESSSQTGSRIRFADSMGPWSSPGSSPLWPFGGRRNREEKTR